MIAGFRQMTNREYHADRTALSNSVKELFRKSPEKYQLHINGLLPQRRTKALRIGSGLHCAMEGRAYDELDAITAEESQQISGMAAALRSDPWIARRLAAGKAEIEQSGFWQDPDTGIWCKFRPDWMRLAERLVLDWKKTDDVSEENIAASIQRYGYYRQEAWYRTGLAAILGCKPMDFGFAFAFVEDTFPHLVEVKELGFLRGERWVERGIRENQATLRQIAACQKEGRFCRPSAGQVTIIDAPRWARYANELED